VTGEDPTESPGGGDDPTEPIPTGGEDPTEALPESGGEGPTEALPEGRSEGPTEALPRGGGEAPTERLDAGARSGAAAAGNDAPTEPREAWAPHQPEVKSGTGILVASIIASLALIITYILAGGLDFQPTPVADPCDSRVWTDPSGLEDTAQQLALSAVDGAACDLGVSREQLTRALASDESLDSFLREEGISREQFDQAIKSGLERAVDDAENAGAIDPLVATGIRTAIGFLPVDQIIPLLQNASGLLEGNSGLNDLLDGGFSIEDLLGGSLDLGDLFGGGSDGGSGGGSGNGSGGGSSGGGLEDLIPPEILDGLRGQLPDGIDQNLPDGTGGDLGQQLQDQLEGLLGS
jgi:hypothetical protein